MSDTKPLVGKVGTIIDIPDDKIEKFPTVEPEML